MVLPGAVQLTFAPLCALALLRCVPATQQSEREQTPRGTNGAALHLLLTSDEHGWLEPLVHKGEGVELGGAQRVLRAFSKEGFSPSNGGERGFALVSSGDMWTGPFEDIVLEGAPMVAVMNRIGYSAAALGNHEFDFGVGALAARSTEANFPFLAANLTDETGKPPPWVKPFVVVKTGGVALGIVGMTNVDARATGDPRHMTGLHFEPYEPTLDVWVARARAAGAQEVIVVMHEGAASVEALLPVFRRSHVHVVLFGHDHHAVARVDDNDTANVDDDVVMCNGGPFYRSYCRVDLAIDGAGHLTDRVARVQTLDASAPDHAKDDAELAAIISNADGAAEAVGSEVLAVSANDLTRGPHGSLGELVVDAWLRAFPKADIAMLNAGGLRQDLQAGDIRVRDIMSAMPFDDKVVLVHVTGAQVKEALSQPGCIVGGASFAFAEKGGKREITDVRLQPSKVALDDARSYVVAINDFMYEGGDHYRFGEWDRAPVETGVDWRDPLLRELRTAKQIERTPDARAARR